jgi:nucleoredoxin
MRGLAWALVFVAAGFAAHAAPTPLTAKDVALMLRAGYSSSAVMKELAARRFADALDQPKETALNQAGATPELISTLKKGTYAVPPEQANAAKEKLVAEERRRAAAAEEARKFDTLYRSQVAQQRAAAALMPLATTSHFLHPLVKGDLVYWHNGSIARFDDDALEKKKLIALYFSAQWCGPCRKFTPQLVDYYNRVAPQHPEFEIIFVSDDRNQFGFETYLREANMPWPAIDYQKLPMMAAVRRYAGDGIPCLVVVDPTGKVVSDTFAGKQYLGPAKVLSDLDAIFAGAPVAQVAAARQ